MSRRRQRTTGFDGLRLLAASLALVAATAASALDSSSGSILPIDLRSGTAADRSIDRPSGLSGGAQSIEHPAVYLLDDKGKNVLSSRGPVSTMRTCAVCHDTEYITTHSYHATLGFDELVETGSTPSGRPWDSSPGPFGRWSPLTYRYLSPEKDNRPDLGTAEWIRLFGRRHTGGGPAVLSRAGIPLDEIDGREFSPQTHGPGEHDGLSTQSGSNTHISDEASGMPTVWNPEIHVLDEESGMPVEWDWAKSGIVEFNCFICHIESPDGEARSRALRQGRFKWAATATLERTGLVSPEGAEWRWIAEAFEDDGSAPAKLLRIVPPSCDHCGVCHGLVHTSEEPVYPSYGRDARPGTEVKGQIFSPQRLFESGMNLAGKYTLSRPWDIHAERLMDCADCHFALNDPAYASGIEVSPPEHLAFDARRLDIGEFLMRPDHNFAKGRSSQGTFANALDGTMRRCEDCHDVSFTHDWLPYKQRHMDRLLCESCHIPIVNAPARRVTDWTVLTTGGGPRIEYRGVQGHPSNAAEIVNGYRPLLLPRESDGRSLPKLAPHNVIASWFWVCGDPPRPVRLLDLKRAFFQDDRYRPEIVRALDGDGDGAIGLSELLLDTEQKTAVVRGRLEALGLADPRVAAELQPYSLHHGVVTGTWPTRECTACHSHSSVIARPVLLASAAPGGVMPVLVGDSNASMDGDLTLADGRVHYTPATMKDGFYIIGHDRRRGLDIAGIAAIAGVLLGVAVHGGSRLILSRTRRAR